MSGQPAKPAGPVDLTEWNFPSSSRAVVGAGGRWSLGDFERTELRKESERKGGEGVPRRARGREARSGARRKGRHAALRSRTERFHHHHHHHRGLPGVSEGGRDPPLRSAGFKFCLRLHAGLSPCPRLCRVSAELLLLFGCPPPPQLFSLRCLTLDASEASCLSSVYVPP